LEFAPLFFDTPDAVEGWPTPKESAMKPKKRITEPVAHESASILDDRNACLHERFPKTGVEAEVQFDKLQAVLGDIADDRAAEWFSFTWAGKRDAMRLLQMPTRAMLTPMPEESGNFATTQNLFSEGDIRHRGNFNSYHDDPHDANGRFDFVLANPSFNKTFLGFLR
jgi:hypothetical protein